MIQSQDELQDAEHIRWDKWNWDERDVVSDLCMTIRGLLEVVRAAKTYHKNISGPTYDATEMMRCSDQLKAGFAKLPPGLLENK